MKFILALIAFCLFSYSLAVGQQTPPASGRVGPAGAVVSDDPPPPAKIPNAVPPAGARRTRPKSARPGELIAVAPPRIPPLPSFDRWVTFESPGGGFTIKFPAKPVSSVETPGGPATTLRRYVTVLDAGAGRYFEVDYLDHNGQFNQPVLTRDAGLDAMVNYLVSDGMQVVERRTITNGKCEIPEVLLRRPLKGFEPVALESKIRTFFSGDKLYVMVAQTSTLPEDVRVIDNFLDSFSLAGGCAPASGGGAPPKITRGTAPGALDPTTGWQRFEDSSGISFLLPTAASTETVEQSALGNTSRKLSYLSSVNGVAMSVEIIDGSVPMGKLGLTPEQLGDLSVFTLRRNLAERSLVLGVCTPLAGSLPARECSVTGSHSHLTGRVQIFVTPSRMFFAMAIREAETTDRSAEDRFFSSIKIEPK